MLTVRVLGVKEADAALAKLADGARAAGGAPRLIGSNLKYAYGIETGYKRSGALARRAGGAFMLTNALAHIRPRIKPELAAALPGGALAIGAALDRLAFDVQREAMGHTPVGRRRGGTLRDSLHVEGARRGL